MPRDAGWWTLLGPKKAAAREVRPPARWRESNFLTYCARTSTPPIRPNAFAQVRPGVEEREALRRHPSFDTPTGYPKGPLSRVSAGQGLFVRVVAG